MTGWFLATQSLLLFGLVGVLAFIWRYARHSPWMATFQGRTLMTQKIAMALLLIHFLLKPWLDYPGERIVEVALIGLLTVLFWVTLGGLLIAQTEQRPVSKKHGSGYVPAEDLEKTRDRKKEP